MNEQIHALFQFQIAKVVAIAVLGALLIPVNMCEIIKVEPGLGEPVFRHFDHFLSNWNQGSQHSPVFFKDTVNFPDLVDVVRILLVMVRIATLIITEFFVQSSLYRFSAMLA